MFGRRGHSVLRQKRSSYSCLLSDAKTSLLAVLAALRFPEYPASCCSIRERRMKPLPAFAKRSAPSGLLTALVANVVTHFLLILVLLSVLIVGLLTARGVEWLFPHTASAIAKVLHWKSPRMKPSQERDSKANRKAVAELQGGRHAYNK